MIERMRARHAGVLPLLVWAVACGAADDGGSDANGGEWAGTVTDSAGVEVVTNPVQPTWDESEAWTVTRDLDIGVLEGAPEYQFGQIAGIDVDAQGRIYVLDQQAQRIGVYSPEGEFSHWIGSPGNGPGEISGGAAGLLVSNGEVLVPEVGAQRVSIFGQDGEFLRSWRMNLEAGFPVKWSSDAEGRPVAQLRGFNPAQQSSTDPIVVFGDSGQVADTLIELARGQTFEMTETGPRLRLFEAEPIWEMTKQGGIASAMNNQFRIEVRGPEGAVQRVVKLEREPQPISAGEKQRILDMMGEMMRSGGAPPQAIDQMLGNASVADNYPVMSAIFAGPDNTLWVQRVEPLPELAEGETPAEGVDGLRNLGSADWDVFGEEGRYLGMVTMPEQFQPARFTDDAVYGVWRDDMDVQHVVRLRLQRGGTPAATEPA